MRRRGHTVAMRGRMGGGPPAVLLTSTVDATGLLWTLTWNIPVSAGVGSPAVTADGVAIATTYSSGAGTNTWVYAITNGNPSGNPVLQGATVAYTAAAGVWVSGSGVPSASVAGGSVVNGSEVQNVGNFVAASTQYLSVANNSTLQTGVVDWWVSAWIKLTTKATGGIVTRWAVAGACEFTLWYDSGADRFKLSVSKNGFDASQTVVTANTFGAPTTGVWAYLFARLDSTGSGTPGLSVNAGTEDTGTMSSTIGAAQTVQTRIGAFSGTTFPINASIRNVVFGKNLPGGFATTTPATIATALYAGGDGLRPSLISSAQRTAWGVVSGWVDTSLTADVIGSSTLTNNGGVTLTTEQF